MSKTSNNFSKYVSNCCVQAYKQANLPPPTKTWNIWNYENQPLEMNLLTWERYTSSPELDRWVFPKIGGKPPKSSILIGFSIIFTIHFGVPLFLETSRSQTFQHHQPNCLMWRSAWCESPANTGTLWWTRETWRRNLDVPTSGNQKKQEPG